MQMDALTIMGCLGAALIFIGLPLADLIEGMIGERRSKRLREKNKDA
ncbi:hypothetical protein EDD80_11137 [Anseongella ginsenosidimutans]|uniref:Uncharacterized protein n=1 Tax=Anseongella ginsenosidimutans TaxID=496056 RepID=A0A4R3KQC3_9SPHI|nr:hypothetical protein EDD80_11137 [Anseongella ginsenosidimutans]